MIMTRVFVLLLGFSLSHLASKPCPAAQGLARLARGAKRAALSAFARGAVVASLAAAGPALADGLGGARGPSPSVLRRPLLTRASQFERSH